MTDAGFQDIKIDRIHVDRVYPSADDWWSGSGPAGARLPRVAPEAEQEHFRERGLERLRDAGEHQRTRRLVALVAHARM